MTPQSPYRDQGVPALVHGAARLLRPAGQHLPRSMRETCWSDHVAFDERGRWLDRKAPPLTSRLMPLLGVWPRALWFVASAIVLPQLVSKGILEFGLALQFFVASNVIAYIVVDSVRASMLSILDPSDPSVVAWLENRNRAVGAAHTSPTAGPARQYVAGLNAIVCAESSWALEEVELRWRRQELADAIADLDSAESSTDRAVYERLEAHIACAYSDLVWHEFVVDPCGDAPPPFFKEDGEAWEALVRTCENIDGSWGGLALAAWWYERQGDRVRARELLHAELSKANAHELRERMPALWSWIEMREPGWVAFHRPAESERIPGVDTRVATDGATEARPAAVANRGLRAPVSRCEGGGEDEEDVSVYEVSKRSSGR